MYDTLDSSSHRRAFALILSASLSTCSFAFSVPPRQYLSTSRNSQIQTSTARFAAASALSSDASISHDTEVDYSAWLSGGKIAPWITFETAEKAAEDMHMSVQEFEYKYADVEAYTSCDDEGDRLHECSRVEDFLYPTKWLHLRSEIKAALPNVAAAAPTEDEIWSQPAHLISLADTVTKKTMDWCEGFIAKSKKRGAASILTNDSVRFKVVPANFGLEGLEDAIREASIELLQDDCKPFTGTLIIAAPDTADAYADPTQVAAAMDEDDYSFSDVLDFDSFLFFAADLEERLVQEASDYKESAAEGWDDVPISDYVTMIPFHPHWDLHEDDGGGEQEHEGTLVKVKMPPYPTILLVRNCDLE